MDKLSINIKIENRNYPMKINTEDEEDLRLAGKLINDKIKMFRSHFNRSDLQDLLSMIAIEVVSENIKLKNRLATEQDSINKQLEHLDKKLSNYLV